MADFSKMLNGLAHSGMFTGLAGGVAGGAVASMLTSKTGRKMGKSALKIGALAAVGGVAWKAYQSYKHNAGTESATAADAPPMLGQRDDEQLLILRAMIAAAYADGHIDTQERGRIFEQVEQLQLSNAQKAQLFNELQSPVSQRDLVSMVTNLEVGAEVYAASLLALDQTQAASRLYLSSLATNLQLPAELVQSLHQEVAGNQAA